MSAPSQSRLRVLFQSECPELPLDEAVLRAAAACESRRRRRGLVRGLAAVSAAAAAMVLTVMPASGPAPRPMSVSMSASAAQQSLCTPETGCSATSEQQLSSEPCGDGTEPGMCDLRDVACVFPGCGASI